MSDLKMTRTWTVLPRTNEVDVHTRIVSEDGKFNTDQHQIFDKEKVLKTRAEVAANIEQLEKNIATQQAQLGSKPPAKFNLEPRLQKLDEDLTSIQKFREAENAIKRYEGMEEQLKIMLQNKEEHDNDLKSIKKVLEELQ